MIAAGFGTETVLEQMVSRGISGGLGRILPVGKVPNWVFGLSDPDGVGPFAHLDEAGPGFLKVDSA